MLSFALGFSLLVIAWIRVDCSHQAFESPSRHKRQDIMEKPPKIVDVEDRVELDCAGTIGGKCEEDGPCVTWYRDGLLLSIGGDSNIEVNPKNKTSLIIKEVKYPDDLGIYVCEEESANEPVQKRNTTSIRLEGRPHIERLPESITVYQENTLTIECNPIAWPHPLVMWTRNKTTDDKAENQLLGPLLDGRISFETANDIENSVLVIKRAEFKDRGHYRCHATTTHHDGTTSIAEEVVFVRIKNKLAFLWPAIGLFAEVFLLLLIIVIFETFRARKKKAARKKELLAQSKEKKAAHKTPSSKGKHRNP